MLFLAQADVNAINWQAVSTVVVGLGGLGVVWKMMQGFQSSIVSQVQAKLAEVTAGANVNLTNAPLTVQAAQQYVSRTSYIDHCRHNATEHRRIEDKQQAAVDAIRVEMKEMERLILKAGEERAKGIHDRLNDIVRAVGRVEGNQEHTS
jgi:ABC-type lipoprotein release transport system permease subunit